MTTSVTADGLVIRGMAVNTGTKTTSVVRIVALVYDTKGQPIWAEAGFVDNNILPGQSSPFSMVLPDSSAVEVIGDIPAAETSVNGLGLDPSAHPAAARASATRPLQIAALHAGAALTIRAIALPDIDATSLAIGPFLTDAGNVLNDGAAVLVQITTPRGALPPETGWVFDGGVRFTVLISPSDFPISIDVKSTFGTVSTVISGEEVLS